MQSVESIRKQLEHQAEASGIYAQGLEFSLKDSSLPLLGVAIHAGSQVREDLREQLQITELERRYEEDPATDHFVRDLPSWIAALDSRFEYDLNRPRGLCVYRTPVEAWGLRVWKSPLAPEDLEKSRRRWDRFFELLRVLCDRLSARFERFAVLDMHSFNTRARPGAAWHEGALPELNLGTVPSNLHQAPLLASAVLKSLREVRLEGRPLRVTHNEIFMGGFTNQWISRHYPQAIVLSLEIRKIFLEERSCELIPERLESLVQQVTPRIRDCVATVLSG